MTRLLETANSYLVRESEKTLQQQNKKNSSVKKKVKYRENQ